MTKRMKIEQGKVYQNERGVQFAQSGSFIYVRYPHLKSTSLYLALAVGPSSVRVNCKRCRRVVRAIEGRARYHRTKGVRCPGTGVLGYHAIHCCNCVQDVAEGQLLVHIDSHDTRRRRRRAA